ncbi:hypothetical protein GCM10018793_09500 [Streptomyces sulfonofaciens]|uniref:Glycosyl hydrolase n=1 Tax=Streptomyces sulfonofaciens TaxID=68272 RepID=A0A919KTG0_9ACTN|nr:glycosyl hydrolase [Streptomyces sulfonofaciens]GHH72460.1 hypothetical protein GCM10018793_09500 [Streptomyces sulfonofaciens]
MTATPTARFGVNYTPSRDWFHTWLAPDWDSIRRDFDGIASLGLDHVRIFPLWPVLQPNRTLIRSRALDDVRTMAELAAAAGLAPAVDVIQGHLSSFDYLPAWLTTWHARNMFTDAEAVQAQARLVGAVHEAVSDVRGFIGLTIGNELNQFSDRPHPNAMRIGPAEAEHWLGTLLAAVPAASPGLRAHAVYDAAWYLDGHPFLPAQASRLGDVTVIHSWIFNGTAQHYGGLSQESVRHAEYLGELSRAFAADVHRPVWLQEIGAPLNCLTARQAPDFCESAVRHAAATADFWGVTWWCSHDVHRDLGDFPALEYSLGLLDSDGAVKPVGRRFADVAAELRASSPAAAPARGTAVAIAVDDDDTPLSRAALAPGGAAFTAWHDLVRAGERPTFVTSRTAADPAALRARGVTSVVVPGTAGRSVYTAVSESDAAAGS